MSQERDPRPALAIFYAAYFANMGILVPFLPPWLREQGIAPATIGALLALQPLAKMVAPWTWGRWADRTGERRVPLAIAMACGALAIAALGALRPTGLGALFAIVAVYAVCSAPGLPYAEATVLEQSDRRRFAYGPVRLWGSVAFIGSSWGFGILVDRTGAPVGFLAGAGLLAVAGIAAAAWPPAETAASSRPPSPVPHGSVGAGTVRLFVACALMQASQGAYYGFYSIRLREIGYGGAAIGALWALGVLCEVALLTRADRWIDRIGTGAVMRISLVAAAVRWTTIAWVEAPAPLVAAQVLHALTYASFHVAALREMHRRFPPGKRAEGQTLFSGLTYGLGGLVGMLLAGGLAERAGIGAAFLVSAAIAALGLIVLGARPERRTVSAPPPR
jgi:PPP family 3-phenylpropionic acid transporter